MRGLVEEACALGLELAVVSSRDAADVDGQLGARPAGPGVVWLLLNRGSEAYCVDRNGPRLVHRRMATAQEDGAPSRAPQLTREHLATRGLQATTVSARQNRRRIDLVPEPEWADPPRGADRRAAGGRGAPPGGRRHRRPRRRGGDLPDGNRRGGAARREVTSDVKHVEIGLTDNSDSGRWIMRELRRRGIAPGQVLVVGHELGPLGGLPGSDSSLLVDEARGVTAVSVGIEPGGVPVGVVVATRVPLPAAGHPGKLRSAGVSAHGWRLPLGTYGPPDGWSLCTPARP